MTIEQAKADIRQSIRDGEHEMEAGYPYENPLNDRQRALIAAYAEQYGECWLGKINLYDEDRGKPVIWKWDGGLVYNFGARFVLPCYDADLERLIIGRDIAPYSGARNDALALEPIFARIKELGGEALIWN